ncbi:MAG: SirA family protein [Chloroflexi bacterium]|nr:SirA family protein [Chloroflexota bacterium]
MSITVDVRGLSCPQPVILVQKAIDKGEFPLEVLADSVTSRENVRRIAEKLGCNVEIIEQDDEFKLVISR